MNEDKTTLYQKIVKAGIPHESHCSDLYVKDSPEIQELLKSSEFNSNVTTFVSDTDGSIWLDIPFAYEPYWIARGAK